MATRYPQHRTPVYRRPLFFLVVLGSLVTFSTWVAAGDWLPLAEDGIHDPTNPALKALQEPREALSQLPPDGAGNQVRWVNALREGYIEPRTSLLSSPPMGALDLDILMMGTGDAAYVLFPHKPHTEWMDCGNCHEGIFKMKAGGTAMNMLGILNGQFCGRCHGAVSFPLTECSRCHSIGSHLVSPDGTLLPAYPNGKAETVDPNAEPGLVNPHGEPPSVEPNGEVK